MIDASSKTILIIQTAFIGDTILASQFARAVKTQYPNSRIHFFLRKGNESVIQGLDTIEKTWVWDKAGGKTKNLFKLISDLRKMKFDLIFNLHRHFNSGLVAAMVPAKEKIGFKQNPLSIFYTRKVNHQIPDPRGWHEVQRNLELLGNYPISPDAKNYRPELPITSKHFEKVAEFSQGDYFVIAPASVWFTKAWSESKYKELSLALSKKGLVYFIGGPGDKELCERIGSGINLCGKLSLLESAALMKNAKRVFVNDSAPLHLASCVNAKTTAIFCSTIPGFGYTPLAQDSIIIDVSDTLACRPCGLHGHRECPLGHFKCSLDIDVSKVLDTV